jgi:hypothetical protein
MALLDWFTKRKKPLSQLTRSELRRQELLLEKDRMRMLNRVKKLAADKQEVFEKGADEKTPEVRRMLAQEFELKTTEQLMLARQLNIRSKELLTVSRLRMLRENADRAKSTGSKLGLVSETDILKLGKLIESDSIRTEVYQERLDEVLSLGAEVDEDAKALTDAGQAVLNVWEKLDQGSISDAAEAFDEADRRVREQQSAAAEE